MFERKPGIYLIKCAFNGKTYVGSTKNVKQRIWDHQSALRRGKHANSHIQNAWNAYGEGSFTFEVLEYVEDKIDLLIREQYYIDTLLPLFNIREVAETNAGVKMPREAVEIMRSKLTGLKRTEETKQKISDARTGFVNTPESIEKMKEAHSNISPETRLRMSVAKLGVSPVAATEAAAIANTGKERSQEVKDKISASKKGKPVKNQAAATKAAADKARGKPRSEETSRKIAETVARKKALGLTAHSPETIAKIRAARQSKP
jgi:group I intron endonuclease